MSSVLPKCTSLRLLNVSGSGFKESSTMCLTALTALTSLDLSFTEATFPPPLVSLKQLAMNGCNLGSDWDLNFAEFLSTCDLCQPLYMLDSVSLLGVAADAVRHLPSQVFALQQFFPKLHRK